MNPMKLPKHIVLNLLTESLYFRSYVADLLCGGNVRETVESLIQTADGKIDAIKKVREFFKNNQEEFKAAFPEVPISNYDMIGVCIGLADAKRFVESKRDFTR
jgi:acetyl-CoA carboxylase carboxyltransferase component